MEKKMISNAFSKNLRRFRKEKNLSQKSLAEMAGLERKAIISYESGKRCPNLWTIEDIAGALKVEPMRLLQE